MAEWGECVSVDDDWRQRAACRDHDPELFFPTPLNLGGQNRAAKVCTGCPVQAKCNLAAARLGATDGVWAGAYYDKRGAGYKSPVKDVRHGTPAGARRHYRLNEKPCELCRQASNADWVHRKEFREMRSGE
jgi:WhiB family redox-sensing transcriptional regulator